MSYAGRTIKIKGHTRKDGTKVKGYTRVVKSTLTHARRLSKKKRLTKRDRAHMDEFQAKYVYGKRANNEYKASARRYHRRKK